MDKYAKYLRKSRYDRDYAELSVEETLKRHEAILDQLARDRGYLIAKTYHEVVSGESIADRPMIRQLLDEVNRGLYAGVLVVDVERLARGSGADQAYISQVFQFSGTKIITPSKIYDPNDEFDQEYFEFGLFMSRREYKTITRRLTRGRDSSAAEGKYLGSIPPYGYQRKKLAGEKGYTLIPDKREAPAVKDMFARCLRGEGTKKIANSLNDRRVPTRHGGPWTYPTVAHILDNPIYMGRIRRGYCRTVKSVENGQVKKRIKRQESMEDYAMYPGRHEPIIDEDTFFQAQMMRKSRGFTPKTKENHELKNAFAGLIFCAVCGRRVGRTVLSQSQHQKARMRCVNMRSCHNGSADYELVEREILAALRAWLAGYLIRVEETDDPAERSRAEDILDGLIREEARLRGQMDQAYDLVEQGVYTPEVFRERQMRLMEALEQTGAERKRAEEELERLKAGEKVRKNLAPRTEELLAGYEDMTVRERNELFKTILRRIEYRKSQEGSIEIDLYPILPKKTEKEGNRGAERA